MYIIKNMYLIIIQDLQMHGDFDDSLPHHLYGLLFTLCTLAILFIIMILMQGNRKVLFWTSDPKGN